MPELELTGDEQAVLALWASGTARRPFILREITQFTALTPQQANRAVGTLTEGGQLVGVRGARLEGLYGIARRSAMYYCPPQLLAAREAEFKAAREEREQAERVKKAARRVDRMLKELHLQQWQELFDAECNDAFVIEPYSTADPDSDRRWCLVHNNAARNIVGFPGSEAVCGTWEQACRALAELLATSGGELS